MNPLNAENTQNPQSAREQALSLLRRQGVSIPAGMENDPNALLNHVLQSGHVPQGRLGMARQIMQRMFGR